MPQARSTNSCPDRPASSREMRGSSRVTDDRTVRGPRAGRSRALTARLTRPLLNSGRCVLAHLCAALDAVGGRRDRQFSLCVQRGARRSPTLSLSTAVSMDSALRAERPILVHAVGTLRPHRGMSGFSSSTSGTRTNRPPDRSIQISRMSLNMWPRRLDTASSALESPLPANFMSVTPNTLST